MSWVEHIEKLRQESIDDPQQFLENMASKAWRMQNLYPIKNKQGKMQRLSFNKHQVNLLRLMGGKFPESVSVLKSRQIGATTLSVIYLLDEISFYNGVAAAIVSHSEKSVNDIFRIAKLAFDNMFELVKFNSEKRSRDTRTEIYIPQTKSRLEIQLEVRSKTITHILFSEYAFTEMDRIISTEGSLPPNAFKVIESTPNGLNHFHDLYFDLKKDGRTLFVPWFEHDEYRLKGDIGELTPEEKILKEKYNLDDEQLLFRREKIRSMGALKFAQEYPENDMDCFLLSGSAVVDRRLVQDQREDCMKNPPIEEFYDGSAKIKIFKRFTLEDLKKKPAVFSFGADPAEGIGRDYSALTLLAYYDNDPAEVVLTIRGFVEPSLFAKYIAKYMGQFSFEQDGELITPIGVVERNNHGHALLQALLDTGYNNLYIHKDKRYGFVTTKVSKKSIQADMFSAIVEKEIKLRDEEICNEILTLVLNDNGSVEAETGKHDDIFMSTALAFRGIFFFRKGISDNIIEEEEIS